ncbi:hypothetical protein K0B90_12655 [bacterium]|nr:hypothetical protein [bacterium]
MKPLDPREAALGKTASEEPLDRLRDDVPQRTEVPLEPPFVLAGEPVEELVEDGMKWGSLGAAGAV